MGTHAIFLAPLGEGDPGLDGWHVSDVADERETLGPGRKGGKWLLSHYVFDEVETDTRKNQVQPCDVGKHCVMTEGEGERGLDRCCISVRCQRVAKIARVAVRDGNGIGEE